MTTIENLTLEQVLQDMKKYKSSEKEGWVLNIDGHLIKIKCDDYVHLHRLLDKVSSVNVIIQNIADGKYNDMISKIPDAYKSRVEKIANVIMEFKNNTNELINNYYNEAPKDDKKSFMIWVTNNCPEKIKGYVRAKYLGQNYNVLKGGNGSYKKLKDMDIYKTYSALFADLEE